MSTVPVDFQVNTDPSATPVQSKATIGGERETLMRKHRSTLIALGMAIGLGSMISAIPGHSLELSAAVAQALNNRPEVSQAIYATAAARERVGSSMADYLPSINLRAANGREESDNPTTQATGVQSLWLNPKQRGITVTQNLYRGFGTTHQVLSSQANARSAAWKVLEVSESMAMRAVDSYMNVLKNRGQTQAAKESVDSHKALLELVQRRAETGAGTKADVNQSQARVKQAEAVLAQIQSTEEVAAATFEAIFGYPPGDLEEPVLPEDLVPKERKEALKLALGIHPAIFAAQEAYFASKEQALSHNSPFAPAVNLLLNANNDAHLSGSPGRSESMSAVVEMTINAFSGYRDMHAKREATFNMAQSQSLLDKALLDITENLANSYAALNAAKSRRELFSTQVKENEKVRNAFFKQYRIGQRTLLDLLDVENELFSARNNLVVEHYQELAARHRVLSNMGQLLRTLSIEIPTSADPMTVDFFKSVQSLFHDSDKVIDHWPAMEHWLEQKRRAVDAPVPQKSPFIPGHDSFESHPGDPRASPEPKELTTDQKPVGSKEAPKESKKETQTPAGTAARETISSSSGIQKPIWHLPPPKGKDHKNKEVADKGNKSKQKRLAAANKKQQRAAQRAKESKPAMGEVTKNSNAPLMLKADSNMATEQKVLTE
ncbi:MAG: TolC family outer membrane protein [Magnetococcales bacterium]|nr:TolC family outer membrane protein [Magnetococcales bacterium]MBF0148832.1 TolC family outer membrane protein [Magnetococcales bacterium]